MNTLLDFNRSKQLQEYNKIASAKDPHDMKLKITAALSES